MEASLVERYPFDYDEMQAIVNAIGLSVTASELHGYQVGLLSLGIRLDELQWWKQFLMDYPYSECLSIGQDDCQALYSLVLHSINGLESNDFDFILLLPDDEASLVLRVSSLAEWCAGFLSGIQTALTLVEPLICDRVDQSEQIKELLVDLSGIRQVDHLEISEVDDLLETERNYAEITEYVRVAVMNIYMEIILEVLNDAETQEDQRTVH